MTDKPTTLWRWQNGRQRGGYEKLLLMRNRLFAHFDVYLLRFSAGAYINEHIDQVKQRRHYRLNIVLKEARRGGDFRCPNPMFESRRIKLFRPDVSPHAVTKVERGTRWVLSIGWTRR